MIINSLANKKVKELTKLHLKKYRDSEKKFLVEGEHLVLEAYKKGLLLNYFVLEDDSFEIEDIKRNVVSRQVMKKLSSLKTPTNVVGECLEVNQFTLGDKVLILDNIQDPGNVGTIIRSAVAFGIDSILISENSVDIYNSKVLRSAQGMNFKIDILSTNILLKVEQMKKSGYNIIGTSLYAAKDIEEVDFGKKFALIVGNEGSGVRKEILSKCDKNVLIKMNDNCESLNVAVATSIILYKISR